MSKEYRPCMVVKLKEIPKGISKEERKTEFCVSAKVCSKGMTREEALLACSGPKAERPKKNAPTEELPSFEKVDESMEFVEEEN